MSMMSIQGHLLEITVEGCKIFSDSDWVSRNHPLYVCLEYGCNKFMNIPSKDCRMNTPISFSSKSVFPLIEGLRDLNFVVWKNISNTVFTYDDFMGSGKVQLHNVLSQGYDDSSWPIQKGNNIRAGELKLVLHYANANNLYGSSSKNLAPPGYPQYPPPFAAASLYPPPPPTPAQYSHYPFSPYTPYPPFSYTQPPYYCPPAPPSHHPHYPNPPVIPILSNILSFAALMDRVANLFQFLGS